MQHTLQQKTVKVDNYSIYSLYSITSLPKYPLPIVLVHGLSVSSKYMIPTAECFSQNYNLFALDLPGFGKSTHPKHILTINELADVLARWMMKSKIKKAILLGNSLGCQILVSFSLKYPLMVQSLVLVGPTMDPSDRTLYGEAFRLLKDTFQEPPSSFFPIFADYIKAGMRRTAKTAKIALQDPIEKKLPLIKQPVLLVRGEKDMIVSQEWVEKMRNLIPDAKLVVIKNAAHAVNFNSPKQLVEVVEQFILPNRLLAKK